MTTGDPRDYLQTPIDIPYVISPAMNALTKRELFAVILCHGFIANGDFTTEECLIDSVQMADRLIKELDK